MNPDTSLSSAAPSRFDALDFVRGLAILGMLGSHLVGTEGGATMFERGVTGFLAAIEPTVGALFCVVAGISWSIQAERGGVTAHFRRYLAHRALALGLFGVVFHLLFWKTEILVSFALMMALSVTLLGARPRAIAIALLVFVAATPIVRQLVAPYAAADWLESGLHVADGTVGWVTLRYLLVDGNYPLISWMAFPLMGMVFWHAARDRRRTQAWLVGSSGVAVIVYVIAAFVAPVNGFEEVRRWIYSGWTPTSAWFVLTAGPGALVVVSFILWRSGTATMSGFSKPIVLLGRASLSHYVLHIAVAYSVLRLYFPDEEWAPSTGLWALLAYLVVSVPLTVVWFRYHPQGPLETLWARAVRRPARHPAVDATREPRSVVIIKNSHAASLHAVRSFAPGEVVFPLDGERVRQSTRFTIQVGINAHLDPVSERTSPWRYLNHGCDPNVAIDVRRRAIVARRQIAAREELRFDYNTTEWELAESFVCNCGAPDCVGMARGFAHLSPVRQEVMFGEAAPHIRVLYARRLREARKRQTVMTLTPLPEG